MKKKKLLAVVAHPDDETFGMGGTLAKYARDGVEVNLICATRGEVGAVEPDLLNGYASVGDLREKELCCAADVLGLKKVHFLEYRDSGMPGTKDNQHPQALVQARLEDVAFKIAKLIRQIQPQVVLTFDPIGGYRHPDHIAIHKATVRAFEMAGDGNMKMENTLPFKPDKLYFHIFPRGFLKLMVAVMPLIGKNPEKWGKNGDINLKAILAEKFPTHARINYKNVTAIREKASACHASQGGDRQSGYVINWLLRLLSSFESYMRAYPTGNNNHVEKDLFEGL